MPASLLRAVTGSPGFARGEGACTMPPRKASKRYKSTRVRTANRHRWTGRIDQGAREKPSLRNSANSPRNFGRRGAPWGPEDLLFRAPGSRSEETQATV